MSKHTKGPWTAIGIYEDEMDIVDSRGFRIAEAPSTAILIEWDKALGVQHWADSEESHVELSAEEQNANARLIAAAPSMLHVLIECERVLARLETLRHLDPEWPILDEVRAQIAKATGK